MRRSFLCLVLAALPAVGQQVDDPANLRGERVSAPSLADTLPINHGAPALEQLLRKLRTRASIMMIVAHPDDEDSGLLTLESRGMGARVAMLTLTRGEGGQNLMSGDFNDALGLIRTQELLGEDRYTGTDQFFGTEVDFGFSKTKEETLKQWGHDRVLYDAVRAVRLYRPLVLASVFVGGVTDGHGQHQVSGEICQEVFLAAADPKVFPEMIQQGLLPWAPLRVYARVPFSPVNEKGMFDYATGKWSPARFHNYVTGKDTTKPPAATVTIHEGDKPSIASFNGQSYIQWARQGLALQKTQIGPNVRIPPPGRNDTGYTLMASRASVTAQGFSPALEAGTSDDSHDLFSGLDTALPSLADLVTNAPASLRTALASIDTNLAEAQHLFNPARPELTAPPLRQALHTLDALLNQTPDTPEAFNLLHELRIKRVQLNAALILAHGLTMTATLADPPTGQPLLSTRNHLLVATRITNAAPEPIAFDAIGLPSTLDAKSGYHLFHGKANLPLAGASIRSDKISLDRTPPIPATRPYFSRPDLTQPYYDVALPALRNAPATPAPIAASAFFDDHGVELELSANVQDPFLPIQPVAVVPPVTVNLTRTYGVAPFGTQADREENVSAANAAPDGIFRLNTGPFQLGALLGIHVTGDTVPLGPAFLGPDKVPVKLLAPAGWQVSAPAYNQRLEPVLEHFTLTPSPLAPNTTYRITAEAAFDGHTYTESFRPVGYPGIPATNYYTPATYRATAVEVTTAPNLHVAYLPGTGDDVPSFLPSLGVTPTILTAKDLAAGNLQQYDAIVLGVRAYSAHPELAGPGSDPLNAYARSGGVVIAQYNSGGFNPASAPYPYTLPGDSAHNVVVETQPVAILAPQAALLNWPNKLTGADFKGWIEEWGHGFASEWAPEYQPLLEVHDPEQDPQRGGLLVAPVGQGAYIYCALALYRQLPEGVPGAYRLLANLLSYARNPERNPSSHQ